jgi:hypothetical protein
VENTAPWASDTIKKIWATEGRQLVCQQTQK